MTAAPIGYILGRFPVLSETFILNEILALESGGEPVHIFSLEPPRDSRSHEDLAKLKADVTYLAPWSDLRWVWSSQVRAARRFGWSYLRTLAAAAWSGRPGGWRGFLQGSYIASEARRLGLRHLHGHYATQPASVGWVASRMTGLPYSFTAHAWDIYKTRYTRAHHVKALARTIAGAQFVRTVSDFNQAYLRRIAPGSASKIRRLYNGIDLERFVPGDLPQREPFLVLAVGRLVEKKGLTILIEACRELRDRHIAVQAWIVGTGPLQAKLEAQVTACHLGDRVRLLGSHTQGEVLTRYQSAHLFVLPCLVGADGNRDGLPVAIVEALACGLPVVTTPLTGIPEVVQHRHNGLLVPEGDSHALAEAIEEAIRDRPLYERMRANARASVESRFDLRQTVAELARWFNSTP